MIHLIKNRTSFIVGSVVLIPLMLLRLVSAATVDSVWLFGGEVHLGCWFRDSFGFPCPFCGMTRSILLTLQYDVASATHLNIGGPLVVVGLFSFGILMLLSGIAEQSGRLPRILIVNAALYFGAVSVFSLMTWCYYFLL